MHLARVLLLLGLSAATIGGCATGGDRPDPDFDSSMARPAYAASGPRVLFDEAHHNVHRAGRTYRPFVRLIESDGYRVSRSSQRVTSERLRPFSLFVIPAALGSNERNDDAAFEDSECAAIREWVSAGGALLLITDHYPTGHAVESLARRFGVQLSKGVVEDSTNYDETFEPTHIIYSRENGGLGEHPIIAGRDSSESIERVLTFTGEAVFVDSPAVAFLRLSPSAVARPPELIVERRGGDVIVKVAYGDATAVPGWGQGVALEYGRGRMVVLGEAAMLTAQLHRFDGHAIGMNIPGYDNRQLALNIVHWLSRLI